MIATSSLEAMLPDGVRSRMLNGLGGLDVHILEAGYELAGRPLVLLVHGFPELAFSWRHTMLPLAAAGYHVVAPDLRGFGRTVGGATSFTCDLAEFSSLSKVRDMVALVDGLGHCEAAAIVGHDIGALVAAWSALARPDVFKSVVMMSAPFAGPPSSGSPSLASLSTTLADDLAALARPRKHYILYNCEPTAHADYIGAAQGLASFFRAYFHHKSGDWAGNRPSRLSNSSAEEMARMPTYYIMDLAKTMPQSVADHITLYRASRDAPLVAREHKAARR